MNHCRDCNSDYSTPGTCNCFARGGKRFVGPLSPWYPPPVYPWTVQPYVPVWPYPTYPYWTITTGTPPFGNATITVGNIDTQIAGNSVSLEAAMANSAGSFLTAGGSCTAQS